MARSAFLEDTRSRDDIKHELDTLEIQLFRMQENIQKIARNAEVIGIDQTNHNEWVVIYAYRDENMCQLMLHNCSKPYKGDWQTAIQAEYKDNQSLHISDIKGMQNKGYGSVLMNHLKEEARKDNIPCITGDIAKRDFDHVERLKHFYSKHYFDVTIDHQTQSGEIVWNDV
ncbi:N-acetyltransferase [Lentibacillus lipolyticus]|nr:N-acetyltransferase [Lentibacillus lipolyticus]